MSDRSLAITATLMLSLPLSGQLVGQPRATPIEIVRDLLRSLWMYQEDGRPAASRQIGFQLPEGVLNSYLAASLSTNPRPMITSMQVHLLSGNRCMVDAKINFTELRPKEPSLFSGIEFRGSKSVRAEFHFSVSSGYLIFQAKPLNSEVPISHRLLIAMIRHIAANQPEKVDTTRKIPVPFGLRKLWTEDGKLCGET
jgi:hypothetical protein